MKLTNRLNLPQALVKAVENSGYTKGEADLSVTQLIKPMRIVVLEREHANEISEDVSERLWSLYGQITHKILEQANQDKNVVVERRLYMEIDGIKISGGMDSYEIENGKLTDWKFVTSYKFKKGQSVPEEYEQQLNIYAELLRRNGHKVSELEIIGLLRDHSKMEARRDDQYPELPIARMPIRLWPEEEVRFFLNNRIAEYKNALKSLPNCSAEERWAKPDIWAIKKKGAFKAMPGGLFTDEGIAREKLLSLGSGYEIEYRRGESIRCENYCAVSSFCEQYKKGKV